jgi:AbrB family looped-hinge helix DNA binding protein
VRLVFELLTPPSKSIKLYSPKADEPNAEIGKISGFRSGTICGWFFSLDIRLDISYHSSIDQEKGGHMQTTISTKYQVVIPKPVRKHLNLKPKQKLTVIEKDKMLILIPHSSLEELRGIAAGAKTDDYREKKDRFR